RWLGGGDRLGLLQALQLGHPAIRRVQTLFQLCAHLFHLLGLSPDDGVLRLHNLNRLLELALLYSDSSFWAILRLQLAQHLLSVNHLFDVSEAYAQQVLQAAYLLHPQHIVLRIQPEAAVHAAGRPKKALLFIKAKRTLRNARALRNLTDLQVSLVCLAQRLLLDLPDNRLT